MLGLKSPRMSLLPHSICYSSHMASLDSFGVEVKKEQTPFLGGQVARTQRKRAHKIKGNAAVVFESEL